MLINMKITRNLDEELTHGLKRRAAWTRVTVTQIIEDAVCDNLLLNEGCRTETFKFQWATVRGCAQPDIDLTDRDALIDRMEDQSDRGRYKFW